MIITIRDASKNTTQLDALPASNLTPQHAAVSRGGISEVATKKEAGKSYNISGIFEQVSSLL